MADSHVTFTTGADTWVSSTDNVDHADAPYALLAQTTAVYLIRQGLGNQPTGTTAQSFTATFRAVDNFGGGSVTFRLYRLAGPWSSQTLWADRPAFTADTAKVWTGTIAAGGAITFDTTSFEALRLASPSTDYGYGLVVDTAAVSGRVYTLSAADGALGDTLTARPTLTGTLSVAPAAPYDPVPSSGQAVGVAKPVVRASFGETDILALQFQQKATNTGFTPAAGFSSPAFDSGTVTASDPSLDLSRTDMPGGIFAGFTGSVSYWTMRVRNTDGVWSLWLDPASARFVAKMTLTPTVGAFWYDPLLGLTWTVGGTQIRYQAFLADADDPTVDTADSGETPSAATSWTSDYLVPDSRNVAWTIRVWDNVTDRQATPGVPVYTEATGTYAFSEDATKKKPLGIITTAIGDSPWRTVAVTLESQMAAADRLLYVRDGQHIARYAPTDLAAPANTEAGWVYTFIDWTAQPFWAHIDGAKLVTGGKTSNPVEYLYAAHDVDGIWVRLLSNDTVAQCSGTTKDVQVSDQAGVLQGLGAAYVAVQVDAIGQRSGTGGGLARDFGGTSASDWGKAWRYIKNHPGECQIAYRDTTFAAWVWNVSVESSSSEFTTAFDKEIAFQFAQSGKEHLADEPVNDIGTSVLTINFDGGTEGATIVNEASGGPVGILAKSGTPSYRAAAAKHGAFGARLNPNDSLTFRLQNTDGSSNALYLRIRSNTSGTTDNVITVDAVGGSNIAKFREKVSHKVTLEDPGGTIQLKGSFLYTVGTTAADWRRVLPVISYDGAGNAFVEFKVANESETSRFTDDLSGTFVAASGAPYSFTVTASANITLDLDSVQMANNPSAVIAPVAPEVGLPNPQFTMSGGATSSAVIVKTICDPSDVGLACTVDLSLVAGMTSPIAVPSAAVDSLGVLTHQATGLTAATRYYGRLKSAAGNYFGEQFQTTTGPASGVTYTRKIAVVSCQSNNADVPAVWQDIVDFVPDDVWHVGDWGYWGQNIAASDSPRKDIDKYANSTGTNPVMRAALHSSSMNALTISDHEIHVNGDAWQKTDADDTLGCGHSIRQLVAHQALMPIRTYWDTRTPRQHRGYHFDIGAKVRVHVWDFRSPERNLSADVDSAGKQMLGANQETAFFAALDSTRLNIIVCETSWLADPPPANLDRAADKPWRYRIAQQRIVDKLNGTGPYSGGSVFKKVFVGGDRHYLGYLNSAGNTLGGFPILVSSGTYKNSLDLQVGEAVTWQYGANLRTVQNVIPSAAWTMTYNGQTTSSLASNATAVQVKTALEALSNIAPGDVAVTLIRGIYTVTFGGTLYANPYQLTATSATVTQLDSPVAGYLQLTLSYNFGTGLVTLASQARAVIDTSGPIAGWVVSNVPGGTSSDTWTP